MGRSYRGTEQEDGEAVERAEYLGEAVNLLAELGALKLELSSTAARARSASRNRCNISSIHFSRIAIHAVRNGDSVLRLGLITNIRHPVEDACLDV
ncbi:hypothetical protein NL676_009019 [Syzygium grande]|nr:hypothetical protein NL676_009019 [Syzygium grande]